MSLIITTKNLTKKYGKKIACDSISINVKKGDIYGLIGRNGAGKTTLLKMISSLINPTSGDYELNTNSGKNKIGILIESPGLYPNFNAKKNLEIKFTAEGVSSKDKIEDLLKLVGLEGVNKKVRDFSLGMKQRLGLAIALVGDPDILLLDEPTNGMDPQGMIEFRHLIKRLVEERGITIIVSSHILEELSKIANRFGIIKDGKLINEFETNELNDKFDSSFEIVVDDLEKTRDILITNFPDIKVNISNQKVLVYGNIDSKEINKTLVKSDIYASEILKKKVSVESFYISLTGGEND